MVLTFQIDTDAIVPSSFCLIKVLNHPTALLAASRSFTIESKQESMPSLTVCVLVMGACQAPAAEANRNGEIQELVSVTNCRRCVLGTTVATGTGKAEATRTPFRFDHAAVEASRHADTSAHGGTVDLMAAPTQSDGN